MNNLASALEQSGKTNEAISYLNKAIESQPDFVYTYLHLAQLQARSGNFVQAIETLKKAEPFASNDSLKKQIQIQLDHYSKKQIYE
jgi:tetratricopeptide (TPR) repeat protein